MSVSFSNPTQMMSISNHCHPNSFQSANPTLACENDVEKRMQALAAKDGIRVKEFFIDFDKLRKGTVGEAAVSYNFRRSNFAVPHLHWHPENGSLRR